MTRHTVNLQNDVEILTPAQMKDGQMGIIVEWPFANHIGEIVQKYDHTHLVALGKDSGDGWNTAHNLTEDKFKVRILKKGDIIEIQ